MEQIKTLSSKSAKKAVLNCGARVGVAFLAAAGLAIGHNTLQASNIQVVFTDSQSAVLKADMATAAPAVVAVGQKLMQPFGICVGKTGEFFVSDTGSVGIIGIDPRTGVQRVVACSGILGMPFGIATENSGDILVANGQALVRINPQTGTQTEVCSGGYLRVPLAVAVAANGNIFVADALGAVVAVDPRTGRQTPITSGGYLIRPQGIAVRGNDIYVTDVATPDGNFGVGRIVHVDAQTRQQTVLSQGDYLVGPVGIAIENEGDLIIGDPYTINEENDLFDGAIVRIDSRTGEQTVLARGKESFVNPRCVALVRSAGE